MQLTSHWKQILFSAILGTSLLAGCSKKTVTAPPSDSDTNTTIQVSPPTAGPAPSPATAPAPEAPGPNADAKAYVDFGSANGQRGDLDAAIAAFDSAISIDPKYAPAYYNRGYAKSLQHKTDEAMSNFDQAIQLDPDYKQAYYQRGSMKGQRGDFDGAVADFKQDIRIDPKFAAAYYNLGHVYYFQGDLDGAQQQIEQSLALAPKFSYSYFIRGLIRHAQGHRTEANADFQKSLGLNFSYAAFWIFICESEDGQRGLARKDLTDALNKPQLFKPDEFPASIGSFLLERINQDDLIAKAKASAAPDMADNLCASWFYAGVVRRLNGDAIGAKDCFTKAIATGSKGSEEFVEANREMADLQNQ